MHKIEPIGHWSLLGCGPAGAGVGRLNVSTSRTQVRNSQISGFEGIEGKQWGDVEKQAVHKQAA